MSNDDERFWSKVDVSHPLGCWMWTAAQNGRGYGKFVAGSRTKGTRRFVLAHRYAYELLRGPIPDGMHIDHLCQVRGCVNPDHLEVVDNGENLRRSQNTFAGRHARARSCPQGHPYVGDNLYLCPKTGSRMCRTCRRERNRRRYADRPVMESVA